MELEDEPRVTTARAKARASDPSRLLPSGLQGAMTGFRGGAERNPIARLTANQGQRRAVNYERNRRLLQQQPQFEANPVNDGKDDDDDDVMGSGDGEQGLVARRNMILVFSYLATRTILEAVRDADKDNVLAGFMELDGGAVTPSMRNRQLYLKSLNPYLRPSEGFNLLSMVGFFTDLASTMDKKKKYLNAVALNRENKKAAAFVAQYNPVAYRKEDLAGHLNTAFRNGGSALDLASGRNFAYTAAQGASESHLFDPMGFQGKLNDDLRFVEAADTVQEQLAAVGSNSAIAPVINMKQFNMNYVGGRTSIAHLHEFMYTTAAPGATADAGGNMTPLLWEYLQDKVAEPAKNPARPIEDPDPLVVDVHKSWMDILFDLDEDGLLTRMREFLYITLPIPIGMHGLGLNAVDWTKFSIPFSAQEARMRAARIPFGMLYKLSPDIPGMRRLFSARTLTSLGIQRSLGVDNTPSSAVDNLREVFEFTFGDLNVPGAKFRILRLVKAYTLDIGRQQSGRVSAAIAQLREAGTAIGLQDLLSWDGSELRVDKSVTQNASRKGKGPVFPAKRDATGKQWTCEKYTSTDPIGRTWKARKDKKNNMVCFPSKADVTKAMLATEGEAATPAVNARKGFADAMRAFQKQVQLAITNGRIVEPAWVGGLPQKVRKKVREAIKDTVARNSATVLVVDPVSGMAPYVYSLHQGLRAGGNVSEVFDSVLKEVYEKLLPPEVQEALWKTYVRPDLEDQDDEEGDEEENKEDAPAGHGNTDTWRSSASTQPPSSSALAFPLSTAVTAPSTSNLDLARTDTTETGAPSVPPSPSPPSLMSTAMTLPSGGDANTDTGGRAWKRFG